MRQVIVFLISITLFSCTKTAPFDRNQKPAKPVNMDVLDSLFSGNKTDSSLQDIAKRKLSKP